MSSVTAALAQKVAAHLVPRTMLQCSAVSLRNYATINGGATATKVFKPAFACRRPNQPFPPRKEFLFQRYKDMLNAGSKAAAGGILVLQHSNMTASELIRVRSDLRAALTTPEQPVDAPSLATLEVVRVGVMRAALPQSAQSSALRAWLCGPTCLIRLAASTEPGAPESAVPVADPATVKKTLAALQKHKKLLLLGGRFDDQWLTATGIAQVSELPNIHALRAELAAVLSAPAQRLTALLERIPGDLVRALDTHHKNLAGPTEEVEEVKEAEA